MSDTPETDQVCGYAWYYAMLQGKTQEVVSSDFASQLERERDEARAALRELWQSADAFLPNFDAETIARWRKAAGWEGEE